MSSTPESRDEAVRREAFDEAEVRRRVQKMKDEEIVDFLRETVAHLDALADRLEMFAKEEEGGESRDA